MPRILPEGVEHGTATAYVTHQCGCSKCVQWNRLRNQQYQAKLRERA